MQRGKRQIRFAICLNAKADDDLQVGKVYRLLPDSGGSALGCFRVIDESGEDYLYAARRFMEVTIPEKGRNRLLKAVKPVSA